MLDIGPFTHISVSPNGKFVALYTESRKAYVITSDFQRRLSEHNSNVKTPPKDLQWCGNDAIVIAWEDEVHVVGPNTAAVKFYYDGRVHVIAGKLARPISFQAKKQQTTMESVYSPMNAVTLFKKFPR